MRNKIIENYLINEIDNLICTHSSYPIKFGITHSVMKLSNILIDHPINGVELFKKILENLKFDEYLLFCPEFSENKTTIFWKITGTYNNSRMIRFTSTKNTVNEVIDNFNFEITDPLKLENDLNQQDILTLESGNSYIGDKW